MALFDQNVIINTYVPSITTEGQVYLLDYLAFIEEYLVSKGLVFVSDIPNTTTDQIELDENFVSLIDVPKFFNITPTPVIRLKCHNSSQDDLLIEGVDYTLSKLNCKSKPVFQINLLNRKISAPHYLEVTAKFYFGLESELPRNIYMAVIEEFMGLYENFLLHKKRVKSNGQIVSSVRMGDVQTSYTNNVGTSSILEFTTNRLDKVLSLYGL